MTIAQAMALSPAEKVANGAQMLDKEHPGWHRKIDLGTLRIDDGCKCICGQLGALENLLWADYAAVLAFGGDTWRRGLEWTEWVHAHGFAATPGVTDEWKRAIQARLDADQLDTTSKHPSPEKEEVLV